MFTSFRIFNLVLLLFYVSTVRAQSYGAAVPWTTIEAEDMHTTGTVMGPSYEPYRVETESSGQRCVRLNTSGQFVEFTAPVEANSLVIRYSLPDSREGTGERAALSIYRNGQLLQHHTISSYYCWLYGHYPFTNNPADGAPRHFYDELRIKGSTIHKGDQIRIQRDDDREDSAAYCILDLVDLEQVAQPLPEPANALSITDKRFLGDHFSGDYTKAFRNCIAEAGRTGKIVWIPEGTYTITGDLLLPSDIRVQGAGMWYSELKGNETLYTHADNRVRLKGNGSNIHLADFSVTGKLNYRRDKEENDGIVGSYGANSTIERIWIEHTKIGMWLENSTNLRITGCRMRNTMADGINFCVGMNRSVIEQCTARGTGDDCFAIWPTVYAQQAYTPGQNQILHCTGQLPYLANGAAVYGGESNMIRDCAFTDISQGSGILISTTFPTSNNDRSIDNNFSGTTVVEHCLIRSSGGFDHEWGWRASVEICLDKRSISGLTISHVRIENSLSNGISVVSKEGKDTTIALSKAVLREVTVSGYGAGSGSTHGLYIAPGARGGLQVRGATITGTDNASEDFKLRVQ